MNSLQVCTCQHKMFRCIIFYATQCRLLLCVIIYVTNKLLKIYVMQFGLKTLMLCAYYTGESSVEVKTEADSNDITEHPHDNKPRPYLCTVCDKRFKGRAALWYHKLTAHSGRNSHLCTQCNKCFPNQQCLRIHMNIHSLSLIHI